MCAKRYYMIESEAPPGTSDETELDRLKRELASNDKWENEIATILLNKDMNRMKKIEKIREKMLDIEVHPASFDDDSITKILLDSIPTKKRQRQRGRILIKHLLKRITLTPEGRI